MLRSWQTRHSPLTTINLKSKAKELELELKWICLGSADGCGEFELESLGTWDSAPKKNSSSARVTRMEMKAPQSQAAAEAA